MFLRIKLVTGKVEKRSKPTPYELVMAPITFTSSRYYCGYASDKGGSVLGLVYEKHRKKVTRKRKGRDTITKVVKPAHWVCYYTCFNVDILKAAGLKLTQKARHFTLTPIK